MVAAPFYLCELRRRATKSVHIEIGLSEVLLGNITFTHSLYLLITSLAQRPKEDNIRLRLKNTSLGLVNIKYI